MDDRVLNQWPAFSPPSVALARSHAVAREARHDCFPLFSVHPSMHALGLIWAKSTNNAGPDLDFWGR